MGRSVKAEDAIKLWKDSLKACGKSSSTIDTYVGMVRQLLPDRSINIADVTVDHIDDFVNARDGNSLATKQLRLACSRLFFSFCSASNFIAGDPSKLVGVRKHDLEHEQMERERRKVLTLDMLGDISGLPDFWRIAILFGVNHGFRLSDTAQLTWASFETVGKLIWFPDKTRRRMETDIHPDCSGAIAGLNRVGRYLFPEEREIARDSKRRALLSVKFSRLMVARGLAGYTFHGLRHGFATGLAKAGNNLEEVGAKLGHKSVETTKIYVH